MKKKSMDGKFIDFPLCCLAYIAGDKNKLEEIANFCVVDKTFKMGHNYKIKGRIKDTDFSFMTAKDFDITQDLHLSIALVSKDLGINLNSIEEATNCWFYAGNLSKSMAEKSGLRAKKVKVVSLPFLYLENNSALHNYLI